MFHDLERTMFGTGHRGKPNQERNIKTKQQQQQNNKIGTKLNQANSGFLKAKKQQKIKKSERNSNEQKK